MKYKGFFKSKGTGLFSVRHLKGSVKKVSDEHDKNRFTDRARFIVRCRQTVCRDRESTERAIPPLPS